MTAPAGGGGHLERRRWPRGKAGWARRAEWPAPLDPLSCGIDARRLLCARRRSARPPRWCQRRGAGEGMTRAPWLWPAAPLSVLVPSASPSRARRHACSSSVGPRPTGTGREPAWRRGTGGRRQASARSAGAVRPAVPTSARAGPGAAHVRAAKGHRGPCQLQRAPQRRIHRQWAAATTGERHSACVGGGGVSALRAEELSETRASSTSLVDRGLFHKRCPDWPASFFVF